MQGCSKPFRARGWCNVHYMLWFRTGSALSPRRRPRGTATERFDLWVDKNGPTIKTNLGPCWLWLGKPDKRGYGRFMDDSGWYDMAHRWSYKKFVGLIPAGLVIDHLCGNPPCVNPSHLEPVTRYENTIARGITNAAYMNINKKQCKHGHPFSTENTYVVTVNGLKTRVCKTCQKRRTLEYRQRLASRAEAK